MKYCIIAEGYQCSDFDRMLTYRKEFWKTAKSEKQAIMFIKRDLRKEGYNIAKDNTWDDNNLNMQWQWEFKVKVPNNEQQENVREDNYIEPAFDELDDLIEDENARMRAKSLFIWEDEDWRLPDMNREELRRIIEEEETKDSIDEMKGLVK